MKPAIPFVVIGLICAIAATVSAQNAAPLYEKALASLPTTPADMEAYKNWQSAKVDTATLDFVRRCQACRQLLHQAALAPNCDWGWDCKKGPELLLPELKTLRPLSQAAGLWIRASFEQKREAEGVEAVEDLLLMGHRLTTPPLAITGSMGRALEFMATYVAAAYLPSLTPPSLQKLQSFMDALPADTPLSQSLQKEQAVVIDLLAEAAMTGGHKSFAADMPKQPAEAGRAISVSRELANEAVRITSLPPDQATAAGAAYKAKVAGAPAVCQKTAIGEPEHFAMMEAHHRVNMALFKAAILVVRNGPAAVKTTSDPAGGGPIGYRKTPGGFELTSKLIDRGDAVSLQVGPEPQTQAAAKSHHSATIKANVGVPNGWTLEDPTDFPAGMKGLSITSPPREQMTTSMAVISVDVQKPDIAMDELAKSVLPPKGMPGVENYVVESNQRTAIDGRTAYRCITTGTMQGVEIRWITTATVKKGILYVLTYTTLKSGPGVDDPELKAILARFKID